MSTTRSSLAAAVLTARSLTHDRGGRRVLDEVSLGVGPGECLGVIGPNGAGKSTLLQLLADLARPDLGVVTREPPGSTVGYLAQEHERRPGESVRDTLARRTGVSDAEAELLAASADLRLATKESTNRYERAWRRFESLGATTLDARIMSVLGELGVEGLADQKSSRLSGGQEAKVALAAIELSRFDVVLLDEPTNDLDFEGLARLERWVGSRTGATVVVSHDREFLERVVTSVLELDGHQHRAVLYAGGWSGYLAERANARRLAGEAYEDYRRQRDRLKERAARQRAWAVEGVRRESKAPRDHDTAQRDFRINRTEKLAQKARQSERALQNLDVVDKPFEGWDLRFKIEEARRAGDVVASLRRAVVDRGPFRLGPVDLEVAWGDRIALAGPNGSGKTTLVHALLGQLSLQSGEQRMGPSVVVGVLGQDRRALGGAHSPADLLVRDAGLGVTDARTVLAKFGLGASHATRRTDQLSAGERTRVELALFQSRGVNFLVLDEPTNHLDLAAIEQLESALKGFSGTLLLVSHDRRLLESVEISRRIDVAAGRVSEST